jgi:hypothetical protein
MVGGQRLAACNHLAQLPKSTSPKSPLWIKMRSISSRLIALGGTVLQLSRARRFLASDLFFVLNRTTILRIVGNRGGSQGMAASRVRESGWIGVPQDCPVVAPIRLPPRQVRLAKDMTMAWLAKTTRN